jgi:hypothetical protein
MGIAARYPKAWLLMGNKRALLAALAVASLLANISCGQANSPVERAEKMHGAEKVDLAPEPVKECSDYFSPQQIFALEAQGKLTEADKRSLDADSNGLYCDEAGNKLAPENAASNPQVPPYELLESPGDIPGAKTVNLTVDTRSRYPHELEIIGEDLVAQYGEDYEIIFAEFRTIPGYELYEYGFYLEDEAAADAWNAEMRRRGGGAKMMVLYKDAIEYETFQLMGFSYGAATSSASAIPEE